MATKVTETCRRFTKTRM